MRIWNHFLITFGLWDQIDLFLNAKKCERSMSGFDVINLFLWVLQLYCRILFLQPQIHLFSSDKIVRGFFVSSFTSQNDFFQEFSGHYTKLFTKLPSHHTVNDEINWGVNHQKQVMAMGKKINGNRYMILSLRITPLKMFVHWLFRMREFVNAKD